MSVICYMHLVSWFSLVLLIKYAWIAVMGVTLAQFHGGIKMKQKDLPVKIIPMRGLSIQKSELWPADHN